MQEHALEYTARRDTAVCVDQREMLIWVLFVLADSIIGAGETTHISNRLDK